MNADKPDVRDVVRQAMGGAPSARLRQRRRMHISQFNPTASQLPATVQEGLYATSPGLTPSATELGELAVTVAGSKVQAGDSASGRVIKIPSLEPPKEQPPAPAEIAQATRAMAAKNASEQMAIRLLQGLPPVPPPPPPQPKYPLVTDHLVDGVAEQIAKLPEPQRRQEIIAVHDHLTAALEEHGKFVLNGRLELLESPAQAAEIAAQIINQKIAEMDKAQESAVEEARSWPAATPKPEPAPVLAQTPAAHPAAVKPAEIPTEARNALSADDERVVRARLEKAGYDTWPPVRVGERVFFPIRAS